LNSADLLCYDYTFSSTASSKTS